MCFYRTKLYKACGHTEFRRFMCNPAPINDSRHQSDLDSNDQANINNPFTCGEQPQYVHDLELGVCSHCRKARHPNKGEGRRTMVLEEKQNREYRNIRVFLPESDADEPKDEESRPEQPVVQTLPDRCVNETKDDEKAEDIDVVPADSLDEWLLFKAEIKETLEECRQVRGEYQAAQSQLNAMVKSLHNRSEYHPKAVAKKGELPTTGIERENPKQPYNTEKPATHQLPSPANTRPLSHSVTKVRRDLHAAKGRVRSMIQAINGKGDASQLVNTINHKSMVNSVANTINRQSEPQHPTKPQPPVAPKKELVRRPLPPYPYPDPRTLPKSEKLEVLTKHRYHRLVPIPELSDSKALVVAKSAANGVVLRRAKAIKVRNLNAFHCPVMKPRFGLKRKVLAPPVPRHSTPPVAIPCSKFADLGRRRVSELEWCFVI